MYDGRKINPLVIKIGDNLFLLNRGKIKKIDKEIHRFSRSFRYTIKRKCENQHKKKTDSSSRQSNEKIAHKYCNEVTLEPDRGTALRTGVSLRFPAASVFVQVEVL